MTEGNENVLVLAPEWSEDGDPFGIDVRGKRGLLEDVVIKEVSHLAIISLADFSAVAAMRPPKNGYVKPKGFQLHPLRMKWICPRCGGPLHYFSQQHWLRCAGTNARGMSTELLTCDAPPIDLSAAESLMFRALETFAPGRQGNFAAMARERYDEVIKAVQGDRLHAAQRADHLRKEIRDISRELRIEQQNKHVRAALQDDADKLGAELDALVETLQDMRTIPDDPDPENSLLELANMIDMLKTETPFGFGVNVDALQFRSRLHEVIMGVTMVERGDDRYDVEFRLDGAKALGVKGSKVEIVRFSDQNLKAGFYDQRRLAAGVERKWQDGEYAISDRLWTKHPPLPLGEHTFGPDLRWVVDTMIMTAETGLGTKAIVRLAGDKIHYAKVQLYRASAECELLRTWLAGARPRKHQYEKMKSEGRVPTLRQRMEKAPRHPFLELQRVNPSRSSVPLEDHEYEGLAVALNEAGHRCHPSMRPRVDELLELVRGNHHATWSSITFNAWYDHQMRRGTFIVIVNFLRSLEGLPACASLPAIPNGRRFKRAAAPDGSPAPRPKQPSRPRRQRYPIATSLPTHKG